MVPVTTADLIREAADATSTAQVYVQVGKYTYPVSGVRRSNGGSVVVVETNLIPQPAVWQENVPHAATPQNMWLWIQQMIPMKEQAIRQGKQPLGEMYQLLVRLAGDDVPCAPQSVEVDDRGDLVVTVGSALGDRAVAKFKANVRKLFS